ncbi:hypothetical protein [Lysobacter humi (ex Lee et al. 2017)]
MTADRTGPAGLDLQARALHVESLEHVSPRVSAQLAQRRRAALGPRPAPRRAAWPWATAAVGALALVMAVQLPRPDAPRPATPTTMDASPVVLAVLDPAPAADALLAEDPDLYLWLASNEGGPYAE